MNASMLINPIQVLSAQLGQIMHTYDLTMTGLCVDPSFSCSGPT